MEQNDNILQQLNKQNVRWLREYFFKLLDETICVNKLIDTSKRELYLNDSLKKIEAKGKADQLLEALEKSAMQSVMQREGVFCIFATLGDTDVDMIVSEIKKINNEAVFENTCLSLEFGKFSTEVSKIEKDVTAIFYLSAHTMDSLEDIKIKLAYTIGCLGKDNVIVFHKNCEASSSIRDFVIDSGMICGLACCSSIFK